MNFVGEHCYDTADTPIPNHTNVVAGNDTLTTAKYFARDTTATLVAITVSTN